MSITITTGQSITWDTDISWDTGISWDDDVGSVPVTYTLSGTDEGAGWAEWVERVGSHTVVVTLTAAAGSIVQAGICAVGTINSYDDPISGVTEGLVDYSIVRELNNGAFYVRARDVVREFGLRQILKTNTDFYELMYSIFKLNGQKPIPFRLCDDACTNWEWLVYGRVTRASGAHTYVADSDLDFNILEVL
jgi:hypothetical protein